jgi:hypothetical protein
MTDERLAELGERVRAVAEEISQHLSPTNP